MSFQQEDPCVSQERPRSRQISSTFLHSVSFKHSEQDNAEDAGLETLRLTKETKRSRDGLGEKLKNVSAQWTTNWC